MVKGINSNWNGADDPMIQSETDIDMILDDEVFHSFTPQYIIAATANINILMIE